MGASSVLARIRSGNENALARMIQGDPILVDVLPAGEAIPELAERIILHAGPPIEWERMCGPMRGAICGIAVFEGWADDLTHAANLAETGEFQFHPNHHFATVGPMTGITTRSQPVLVVENRAFGNRAFCTLNEGLGKVMRFGGNDKSVLERLKWIRDVLGPGLSDALKTYDGIPLKALVARGLTMGDEMHQRNVGSSSLLIRELAPRLARTVRNQSVLGDILAFLSANDQFFLNVAMTMGKSIMDPVRGIDGATIVTAMSRNGTDFGIVVSGLGDQWFTAPVEMPVGLYFPGFTEEDANPDMGDSTIVETIGLGGFAMAAAPAVAGFVGAGSATVAAKSTHAMGQITVTKNPEWTMPSLDYEGVPTGIDIRLVVETGIAPLINTGIAHRNPGVGQVGAGVVRAPMECFEKAVEAFAHSMGLS
ncbi:MAG: hypothetical protein CL398_10220 [Acidiferrobacteraceae bacterium]|nr:hypothetical protein [Acidiferrobacteraceae bacterium]|tara:strand:- start:957 stop:2225 length:1269 start_codon:yes stop_codon:yes gene_type:complete